MNLMLGKDKDLEQIIAEAFCNSVIHSMRGDTRRFVGAVRFAHIVWNLYNPNDKKRKKDGYVIHHKDEDTLNDDIFNLQKITKGAHQTLHQIGKPCPEERREKIRQSNLGKIKGPTPDFVKEKIRIATIGEKSHSCRVPWKDIVEIRRKYIKRGPGHFRGNAQELAVEYGVSFRHIQDIANIKHRKYA